MTVDSCVLVDKSLSRGEEGNNSTVNVYCHFPISLPSVSLGLGLAPNAIGLGSIPTIALSPIKISKKLHHYDAAGKRKRRKHTKSPESKLAVGREGPLAYKLN